MTHATNFLARDQRLALVETKKGLSGHVVLLDRITNHDRVTDLAVALSSAARVMQTRLSAPSDLPTGDLVPLASESILTGSFLDRYQRVRARLVLTNALVAELAATTATFRDRGNELADNMGQVLDYGLDGGPHRQNGIVFALSSTLTSMVSTVAGFVAATGIAIKIFQNLTPIVVSAFSGAAIGLVASIALQVRQYRNMRKTEQTEKIEMEALKKTAFAFLVAGFAEDVRRFVSTSESKCTDLLAICERDVTSLVRELSDQDKITHAGAVNAALDLRLDPLHGRPA